MKEKKNYTFSVWVVSSVFIGVLLIAYIFSGGNSITSITGATTFKDIEVKAENFVIKEMGDVEVSVLGVFELEDVIEVKLKIDDEDYVYVFDGRRESLRKV
jgi:hypothetical protein